MIRRLINKVFGKRPGKSRAPHILSVDKHGIRREQVHACALKVTRTLKQAGFEAFLVGGAVRDLLLQREPKDFDVATNATPEEVRSTFRRSRIIGRRFQIVHVYCGADTIEVTTFRAAAPEPDEADNEQAEGTRVTADNGMLLRDNVFGNQMEDAARRDFTVNALYYDPVSETIIDYHHGVADIKAKTLRMIGDPPTRYREDPVRMLRAVRLSAKLGLTIEPATARPIREMSELIGNVPPSRLFDEMLKLLTSGYAVKCVAQLRAEGLHHGLLPLLDVILEQPLGERFVMLALESTDRRVRENKPISPGFLFATLLWHEVLAKWAAIQARGERGIPALFLAMDEVLDVQAEKLAITRRIAGDIKDIWALQPRFEQRSGKRPYGVLEQPRFKAGYDFLLLRGESGEIDSEISEWWTDFLDANDDARAAMLLPQQPGEAKKRRRRKRKPAGGGAPESGSPE